MGPRCERTASGTPRILDHTSGCFVVTLLAVTD